MSIRAKKGFSLIEMVVFVAISATILIIIVNFIILYGQVYLKFKVTEHINTSSITALERMTREIKLANDVDDVLSTFDTHPGNLVLNTVDGTSTPAVIEFYLDNSILKVKKDSVDIGELTRSDIAVTKLIFSFVESGTSQLIKIEMDIEGSIGSTTKSETFLTSAALRGTY